MIEKHQIPVHRVEISPEEKYVFVRHIKGILPEILDRLLKARKQAKADMKSAKGTHLEKIYDGRQNALKISCNSVYGFTGADPGIFSCKPIATTVTCKGRGIIEQSKQFVEENYPGSEVIYGDTDSIMCKFPTELRRENFPDDEAFKMARIEESFRLGAEATKRISKMFKDTNADSVLELSLEKVNCPYFLLKKKNYAAIMYKPGPGLKPEAPELDQKGLKSVKRDAAPITKRVIDGYLERLLQRGSVDDAYVYLRGILQDMVDDRLQFEDYILSKQLKDGYANPERVTQMVVTNKIKARDPGSEPRAGDRVQYVILDVGKLKDPIFLKAEDAAYAKEEKKKLDLIHYIDVDVQSSLGDLVLPFGDRFTKLFSEYRLKLVNKRLGQQDVSSFFEMDVNATVQTPNQEQKPLTVKPPSASLKRAQDTRSSIKPAQAKKQKTATGQLISSSQTTLDAILLTVPLSISLS